MAVSAFHLEASYKGFVGHDLIPCVESFNSVERLVGANFVSLERSINGGKRFSLRQKMRIICRCNVFWSCTGRGKHDAGYLGIVPENSRDEGVDRFRVSSREIPAHRQVAVGRPDCDATECRKQIEHSCQCVVCFSREVQRLFRVSDHQELPWRATQLQFAEPFEYGFFIGAFKH